MFLIPTQLQRRDVTAQLYGLAVQLVDAVAELEFGLAISRYEAHFRQRVPRDNARHFERRGGMVRPRLGGNRNEDHQRSHGTACRQTAQIEPILPGYFPLHPLLLHVSILPM